MRLCSISRENKDLLSFYYLRIKLGDSIVMCQFYIIKVQIIEKRMNKQLWIQEYRAAIIPEKKEKKVIKTYGTFRSSEIDSFMKLTIKEDKLKTLIIDTLKLCYLYDPLFMALIQRNGDTGGLYMLQEIIKILNEGLFYRYMITPKINKFTSQGCLVNNRSTQINVKVVISALFIYISKRLILQEIASCMLIFNLQEALNGLKPDFLRYCGLQLKQSIIIKTLQKIQRTINLGDLRNIVNQIKEEKQEKQRKQKYEKQPENQEVQLNQDRQEKQKRLYITPDQFLYLISISSKNPKKNSILKLPKKNQNILYSSNKLQSHFNHLEDDEFVQAKTSQTNIKGITFFQQSNSVKNKENMFKEIKRTLSKKLKTKSLLLEREKQKNPRPQSSVFKKSLHLIREKSKSFISQKQNQRRISNPLFIRTRNIHENLRKSKKSRYNLLGFIDIKKII